MSGHAHAIACPNCNPVRSEAQERAGKPECFHPDCDQPVVGQRRIPVTDGHATNWRWIAYCADHRVLAP